VPTDQIAKIDSWTRNWWSPLPPERYLITRAPIGAFNLAWGLHADNLKPGVVNASMPYAIKFFANYMEREIDNYPLSEWLCIYKPPEFDKFLQVSNASRELKQFIRPAVLRACKYHRVESP